MKNVSGHSPAPESANENALLKVPESAANSGGESQFPESNPPRLSWPWRKIFFLVFLAAAIHVALICFFGTKKQIPSRPIGKVPRLQLAGNANPFIELNNPALFALPNPRDFSSVVWLRIPVVVPPSFRWDESPQWLPLATGNPGAGFQPFLQSNTLSQIQLLANPPEMPAPSVALGTELPESSAFKIFGSLARRVLLNPATLPSLAYNNVIPPSKIQVLVDTTGNVISAILLPLTDRIALPLTDNTEAADRYDLADQQALKVARGLRFTPASQLMFGEIVFRWHTVPTPANNNTTSP